MEFLTLMTLWSGLALEIWWKMSCGIASGCLCGTGGHCAAAGPVYGGIILLTLHSPSLGRAQSRFQFASVLWNAQSQHVQKQNKTLEMLAIIALGFWDVRVKELLSFLWCGFFSEGISLLWSQIVSD